MVVKLGMARDHRQGGVGVAWRGVTGERWHSISSDATLTAQRPITRPLAMRYEMEGRGQHFTGHDLFTQLAPDLVTPTSNFAQKKERQKRTLEGGIEQRGEDERGVCWGGKGNKGRACWGRGGGGKQMKYEGEFCGWTNTNEAGDTRVMTLTQGRTP